MKTAINTDERICEVQEALLNIPVGLTRIVFGRVITRWAKDVYEIDTFGQDTGLGSESTAEIIVADETK